MKRHIVIVRLFDSGGMNTHFKTLVRYLGKENMILVLENQKQIGFLKSIVTGAPVRKIRILPDLHGFAHLSYYFTTNIKEFFLIVRSIFMILLLSIGNLNADITISVAEPEKYLYLLWIPFLKVTYILHSEPKTVFTRFTTFTCNCRLGKKRRIVTVSNAMRHAICSNWHIAAGKQDFVKLIYNCAEETGVDRDDSSPLSEKKAVVTTMGHVDERKNPETWLKVAIAVTANHPDTEFLWLGNGPLLSDFEKATQTISCVSFPGAVENVVPYLKKSAIYYQPSLTEPHGIAVLEAMYNGLPCVVADTGGLPESVENGYNGIVVDPTNITENVNALKTLLDDVALRKSFGANGVKRYLALFSYDRFKEKMDEIYA